MNFRDHIRSSIWPLPTAAIVLAVVAGVLVPILDDRVDADGLGFFADVLFGGGAATARGVLSAIAGSLITATSLTFSLTVVALQLASSQASPRLLRLFASDRLVQATMAMFLGTFAYSLTVLRSVRDGTGDAADEVPRIAVTVASVLTLISVIALALFLAHLASILRVETMLKNVDAEARRVIERLPEARPKNSSDTGLASPASAYVVASAATGFLASLDRAELIGVAEQFDLGIAEELEVGGSIVAGSPLAYWWPLGEEPNAEDRRRVESRITSAHNLMFERTAPEDVAFGLRQLVDVALHAVSPALNDPTTAVHALNHVSALLCALVRRPPESRILADAKGTPRLRRKTLDISALFELALGQLRRTGAADAEVAARMLRLIREVGFTNTRDELAPVLRQHLTRLLNRIRHEGFDDTERARLEELGRLASEGISGTWEPSVPLLADAELLPPRARAASHPRRR